MPSVSRKLLALACLIFVAAEVSAQLVWTGGVRTWNRTIGTSTNNLNFGRNGNWDGGNEPNNSTTQGLFTGSNIANPLVNNNRTIGQLRFESSASAVTFEEHPNDNLHTLNASNGEGLVHEGSVTHTYDARLAIANDQSWLLTAANGGLVINDSFDLNANTLTIDTQNSTNTVEFTGNKDPVFGSGGFIKEGDGTLIFSGAHTFTGSVDVTEGVVSVRNATGLGTTAGGVTVSSGASLEIQGGIAVGSEALTLNGSGISSNGALRNVSGDNSWAGAITLGSATTLQADAGTLTLSGAVGGGTQALTIQGPGVIELTGSNTGFSGSIDVTDGGTLAITSQESFGSLSASANLTLDDGTLRVTGGNSVDNDDNTRVLVLGAGGGTIDTESVSDTLIWDNGISGSGDLTKIGEGTFRFDDPTTFTGDFNVNEGTVEFGGGDNRLADVVDVTIASGATLDVRDRSDNWGSLAGEGTLTSSLTTTETVGFGLNNTDTEFSGTITDGASATLNITKLGTGNMTLSGNNSFDGTTTVSAGILTITNDNALGTTTGSTSVTSGATLALTNNIFVGAEALTLNGTGNSSNGALRNVSGTNSFAGDITLGSATEIQSDAGTLTLSGNINGATQNLTLDGAGDTIISGVISTSTGTLTKNGTGNTTLSATNTYSGDTTVSAGTLTLSADDALGTGSTTVASGGTLALTGGIDVAQTGYTLAGTGVGGTAGAIQNVSGDNRLTGDFTLSADTTIQATAGTLNVGTFWDISGFVTATDTFDTAGNTLTFDGAGNTVLAAELDGSGNVIKNGTGTLTFENSRNRDWTGTTTINDGELISRNLFNNGTPGAPGTANYTFNDTVTIGDGTGAAGSATLTIGTNDRGAGFNHKNAFADGVDLVINSDGRFNTRGHEQYVQDVTLDGGTIDAWTNANAVVESLFITGSITATESSTINGKIDLNGDAAKVIDVQDSGETLDITALIDNGGFDKQGDGILELSGVNTYTGNVDISEGIVLLESNSGLGAVAGSTNVDSGAQLQLSGVTVGAEALTLNGSGISSDGALQTVASSGANSWAGSVTLASATEIEVSSGSSLTISGNITGSGQTLTVDGPGNSTFTGTDTFNTLNKTGSGTLTLSSNTKTVSTINVSGGTLDLGTSNIITDTADLSISGTGTFTMGGGINETIDQFTQSNGTLDVDGVLTLNGGTISGGDGSDSSGTMQLTAGNTLNITNDYEFGGTLELTAGTTLALSGASTIDIGTLNITGDTTIDFGADANRLDLGALTIAGGVSVTVNNWISFQDLWTTGSFQGGSGSVTIDERDSNTAQITFSGFSPSDTIWLTFDFGSNEITVPEPGTYGATLMAFGLVLWTIRRRPRKAVAQD